MQYENVFKMIGCSCYTCLPRTTPAAAQSARKAAAGYWYWGSSGNSTSTHEHMAKTMHNNKHTSKH